jgi:Tol biopolymer transport system component/DNA-binding winged helix-turn-helix (wHTH) protein
MLEQPKPRPSPIRFGNFEVDLQAGELRRQGLKVKLQEQPFQVLLMLLDRPGEVVTREELRKQLWSADTFVDFEPGLNRAINKLREALADDADSPRFIETLPRRGYRFLGPVEKEAEETARSQLAIVPPERPRMAEDTVPTAVVRKRQVFPWALTGLLALTAVVGTWRLWHAPPSGGNRPFMQLDLDTGPDQALEPAISPDGTRIAYVSDHVLSIRRLEQARATRLAGTDGAGYPFFSPDGQWVAFFTEGKLQKVAVDGGAPITLCDALGAGGGTWGADDNIIAALDADQGISRVPAAGGVPQRLTDSKRDPSNVLKHLWPQLLPDGKSVLFAAVNGSNQGSLRALTLSDGKVKTLVENSTQGRYLDSGYLVYSQQGTLFAAPMDAVRLELTGPAVALATGVSHSADRADFDLSTSGMLVYRPDATARNFIVSWLSPSGKTEPIVSKPGGYSWPRLSPDGTRLALTVAQEGKQNIYVYDLGRQTWTRVTFGDDLEWLPTWTPDGEFIAFRSGNSLAWTRSDGSGKVERLAGVSPNSGPWSFSADGKWLAFWPLQPGSDLWTVPVERAPGLMRLGRPQVLLEQPGSKGAPAISPDERWVAYTSDDSGHFEIYVMPFSPQGTATNRKWAVSNEGGWVPIFSRNGRDLFYQSFDCRVHVAGYRVNGNEFVAEKSREWSATRFGDMGYDVAPDGKRVLGLFAAGEAKPQTLLRVMLNVDSELRRRAPARGK